MGEKDDLDFPGIFSFSVFEVKKCKCFLRKQTR